MPSKKSLVTSIVGLAFVLVIAVPAFAKNSRSIHLGSDAFLNGKQLKEGDYKVQWESHSPEVSVTFSQKKDIVAAAQGRWIDRGVTYSSNTVVYDTNPDGSRTILEIRLAGLKQAIVFAEAASSSQ